MTRDLKDNCFDPLRLILSLAVVYSHGILVGGFGEEQFKLLTKGQTIAGSVSVLGFFGISGFLVTMSFSNTGDVRQFIKSRLFRILPAFYLTLLLTAFFFAPIISKYNPQGGEWLISSALQYIGDNIFVKVGNWHVGEVISGLPYDESINGSLWSLFPELCCYVLVLVFGITGMIECKSGNHIILYCLFVGLYAAMVLKSGDLTIAPTFMTLTTKVPYYLAFGTGMMAYVYRDLFDFGGRQVIVWWLVVALLLKFGGWELASPIVFPIALLHLGYSIRIHLPADYSYGIYLIHVPVMQALSACGLQKGGVTIYLGVALSVTFLFAYFSWHFVEKPFSKARKKVAQSGN